MAEVTLAQQVPCVLLRSGMTFSYRRKRWKLVRCAIDGEPIGDEFLHNKLQNKWWATPIKGDLTPKLFCFDHLIDCRALKLKPN